MRQISFLLLNLLSKHYKKTQWFGRLLFYQHLSSNHHLERTTSNGKLTLVDPGRDISGRRSEADIQNQYTCHQRAAVCW